MTAPELFLYLRVRKKQPPCCITFKYLDRIGELKLRLAVNKKMYVIRHDLHCNRYDIQRSECFGQIFPYIVFDNALKYRLSVLGNPYDVVLKRIYISLPCVTSFGIDI